jgi:choline dehydrogenase-like flavoprotein
MSDAPLPAEPDVLVVGAGAGGGATAWALARHGLRVALIDAGPAFEASEYQVSSNRWEFSGIPSKEGSMGTYEFGEGQRLDPKWDHLRNMSVPRGITSTRTHRAMEAYYHVRGIGGTTLHYAGWANRLHPDDFRMRTLFGVAADWPLSYADLDPYYGLAERAIGVAGPDSVPDRPRDGPFPTPAHRLCTLSQTLAQGARRVGLSWTANPVVAPSRPYGGRPACNYCGCCLQGCELGDKGSTDVTFVRQAVDTGTCTVHPRHMLVGLRTGAGDRVSDAVVVDAGGIEHRIAPRHVVLAAGGIETPRLLLAMDGLGNESGEVGRNLMESMAIAQIGLHPDQIGSNRGLPEDSICWDFSAPGAIPGSVGGGILTPCLASAGMIGPARYADRLVAGFGTEHKRRMREMFGHAVGIFAMCANLPNPGSYVDLSETRSDGHGMPLARIQSRLPDSEVARLGFISARATEVLLASGVPEVLERISTYEKFATSYAFGTCRMGSDPQTSVVNEVGRSHRWQNLWIADASVLPFGGSGEGPTLTIHALGIRTADAISGTSSV